MFYKSEAQDNALLIKNQGNDPEFFLWIKCGKVDVLVDVNPRGLS
ncbi:hypothetical protein IMCC1989_544 [gamma proteobacterium IMCC1989]|nr:hypothetical protein IMCC1989_544 [gamma proteobacterium IMCC1989]